MEKEQQKQQPQGSGSPDSRQDQNTSQARVGVEPNSPPSNPSPPLDSHLKLQSDSLPDSPLSSDASSLSHASPPRSSQLLRTIVPPPAPSGKAASTATLKTTDPAPPGSHLNIQSTPSQSPPDSPLSSNASSLSHDSPPPPSRQPEPNPPPATVSYAKAPPRGPDRPAPIPPGSHLKLQALLSDSSPDSLHSHASRQSLPHHQTGSSPPSAWVEAAPTVPNGFTDVKASEKKAGWRSRARSSPDLSRLRKFKREGSMTKASLAFRISGSIFCLISFSVMVADRDRGWALDSFYRYKEFRYCMGVNVLGFVYSGFQACDLAFRLTTGKHTAMLRYYLDFVLDQMLTYLLVSASSSASVRIDEWQSDWGKDKFPEMASASVGLSFVAFIALALSSLVSGYMLCTLRAV